VKIEINRFDGERGSEEILSPPRRKLRRETRTTLASLYSQLTGAAVASRKRDGVVGFTGRRGASESYQCGDPAAAGQRPLLSTKSTVTVVYVWQCPPPYYNSDIYILYNNYC